MTIKGMPTEEILLAGNAACQGCPASVALRIAFKALGKNTIMVVIASCTSVLQSPFPSSAFDIPVLNMAFATGGAAASGVSAAVNALMKQGVFDEKPTVLVWAGDGGTYDIGIQALSGAAERNADFIYVCYNNEAYSNTGTQRSGATPYGAWTTNTVEGKKEWRKDIAQIMTSHNIPYAATVSLAYYKDAYQKFLKAKSIKGTRYIEILAPCPPGWRFSSKDMIKVSKLAVQSGMWLLYEYENGHTSYTSGTKRLIEGRAELKPVDEYMGFQGRYGHLFSEEGDERVREIQERVNGLFENLRFVYKLKQNIMDIELSQRA